VTGIMLNNPAHQNRCLAVFVRAPQPGKVKTRLAGTCGDSFAAELYGCFVDDLLEALAPVNCHLEIFFTPAESEFEISDRFGKRFAYTPQKGEGLGERMANAFKTCFAKGFAASLLIGSDSPDLTAEVIEEAFQALENGQDAVVGPACDGGYYLIGFRAAAFAPAVFNELPRGENSVLEETLARLRDRECIFHLTPVWHDIDTEQDLRHLWSRHQDSPFGRSRTMAFLRKRRGGETRER